MRLMRIKFIDKNIHSNKNKGKKMMNHISTCKKNKRGEREREKEKGRIKKERDA